MVALRESFRPVLAIVALVAGLFAFPVVAAESVPANPSVEQPKPGPQPPAVAPQPPVVLTRIVHPQVNRLALDREYRSRLLGSAADVAAEGRINKVLEQQVDPKAWSFDEGMLLDDVLTQVRDTLRIPFMIDQKALEEAGIGLDAEIGAFRSQGTSARAALRRLLDPLGLTWMIRDESLLVTTKERAQENLEVRLYPLPWGCAEHVPTDWQSLIDLIINTVDTPSWCDAGGPGSIRPLEHGGEPVLVVSQTGEVQEQVEAVLRAMHERAVAEFGGTEDAPAKSPVVRVHHVADAGVRDDLAAKLVGLCNESLAAGADPKAKVTVVGECLAVQSVSPQFQVLAGRMIRAVAGVKETQVQPQGQPNAGMAIGGSMF